MRSSVWFALVFASLVSAAPSKPCPHKVKETISHPNGWIKGQPAHPDTPIELRIALPQSNFAELERHLYEVRSVLVSSPPNLTLTYIGSDPFHERYGQHLSKEEVEALVTPHPDSIHAVNEWLASHGLDEHAITRSPAKDWVRVTVPVSLAEKMMETVNSFTFSVE